MSDKPTKTTNVMKWILIALFGVVIVLGAMSAFMSGSSSSAPSAGNSSSPSSQPSAPREQNPF